MSKLREFTFIYFDGVHEFYTAEWLPERGAPRAVVQLVHGVSEHIMRYGEFARFLTEHGFAVIGGDLTGHGKTARSPEEYGYLGERDGWRNTACDVRQLRVLTGKRFPGVPYFRMGHSMGSFLVRHYLIDWPGTVDGAILSGTGQESPALVAFGKFIARLELLRVGPRGHSAFLERLTTGGYGRQFAPARTKSDWISRDTAVVDAYVADPLCSFYPTVSMFLEMAGGVQYIADGENLKKMDSRTPVHLFSGALDPVGQKGAGVRQVYALFQKAGCTNLSMKLYPDGRHEMLNEINRQEVYQDVLLWLEHHLPGNGGK
jgi:alpha-beta hydrolase superfamily lysophospholipase